MPESGKQDDTPLTPAQQQIIDKLVNLPPKPRCWVQRNRCMLYFSRTEFCKCRLFCEQTWFT